MRTSESFDSGEMAASSSKIRMNPEAGAVAMLYWCEPDVFVDHDVQTRCILVSQHNVVLDIDIDVVCRTGPVDSEIYHTIMAQIRDQFVR